MTPSDWIARWNRYYQENLGFLEQALAQVNTTLPMPGPFRLEHPQGGWYMSLRIHRDLLEPAAGSSVDAFAVALNYGTDRNSGVALLPGELFGLNAGAEYALRGNCAVDRTTLESACARLADMAQAVRGTNGTEVIRQALERAHAVAPIPAILRHRTF